MIAYYGAKISPHMTKTPEGYLICHDVPINRVGDQQYQARELNLDGDPERMVTVHRYPEDVFDAAAMASFEGKDITQGHPPENLTPETQAAYSKGHIENVRRVGDNTVADLHVKDAGLISDIENGITREVSCGYLCNYEPDGAGYKQTHIRGNHVAVVPRGRAGHDVAIKDAAVEAEKGLKHMKKETKEALYRFFGLAARDAEPEELDRLTKDMASVLDAEPAEKDEAQEAAPAEDVMVERAPKGDDLGSKLDELLSMVRELGKKNDREEKALSSEDDLDKMLKKLAGGERPEGKPEGDPEEAVTIPSEEMGDACGIGRDAAVELLRKVRPAVASIEDEKARSRVVDALLSTITGPNQVSGIMKAAQDSAARNATNASKTNFERICADQKAAYDARNPHKKKEV